MQIAIISDTHLKKNLGQLDVLITEFQYMDLVVHAGDYGDPWVLTYLQKHFEFIGVWGNTDDTVIKASLPEKLIVQLGTYRVGICHAHGKGKSTTERAYNNFKDEQVDIIIFGHSHQPIISTKNKVLLLNPGSLTNKRKERWFTYIVLSIDHELHATLMLKEL